MENIKVNLKKEIDNSYEIVFSENTGKDLNLFLRKNWKKRVLIITDTNVFPLHFANLKKEIDNDIMVESILIKAWEENKNLVSTMKIMDKLIELSYNRNDFVVALWWWVIWDITGFVSSIFKRWISFIQIPTTLLSIFDSSVWGKTWIDYREIKNLIWVFKQPEIVLVDKSYLKTLPKNEILSWYFEWLKHSIIDSREHFDYFRKYSELFFSELKHSKLDELIKKNITVKAKIVEKDEKEIWIRKFLNYGHTFGHAIESVSDYTLSHGVSIAYGIIYENILACELWILGEKTCEEINTFISEKLKNHNLPSLDFELIFEKMTKDKKNISNSISFSLPRDIWIFEVIDIKASKYDLLKNIYEKIGTIYLNKIHLL